MRIRFLLPTLSWLLASIAVGATPSSPKASVYKQPNGNDTPELFLNGDERYAWWSDSSGYTVVRDELENFVYAQRTTEGALESTGIKVGEADPEVFGVEPNLMPDYALIDQEMEMDEEESFRRNRDRRLGGRVIVKKCEHDASDAEPCYYKQLALLVRFSDHVHRELPSPEDIDILFNHNGPTGDSAASTGSIADVYRSNSFDTFVLDTHVTPWQDIDCTEEYASQGKNGFNFAETRECWAKALKKYAESLTDHGLEVFDANNDSFLDGLVIVHSGAAAEDNDADCETGALFNNRIWSHAVPQAPNFEFLSNNNIDLGGIKVGRFYVFSGVYGSCPPGGPGDQWDAGRISVGVHEAGHFLGLPDLYGQPGKDNGIGNWGFMGESRRLG
jgi:M6 family metalloprotease-like protein